MSVLERRGDVPVDVLEAIVSLTAPFEGERFVGKTECSPTTRFLPGISSSRFTVTYQTLSRSWEEQRPQPDSEFEVIGGEIAINPQDSSKYLAVIYAHMSSRIDAPVVAFYATNDISYRNNGKRIRWF